MNLKTENIDIYNNSAMILQAKTPKFVRYWITTLSCFIVLVVFIIFIPFNIYSTYNAYIKDNYLYIKLNDNDFPIYKNKKICIKDECYKYEVVNIDKSNVILDIKTNKYIKIDNNILIINILKDRTNIYKIINNKLKKGLIL